MKTPAKPYHHGHLKPALIDAAEALLTEAGVEGLSLRAVARRSGVSQAAPYAHFSGKQALLAAVAARGFNRLTRDLQRADETGAATSQRLQLLARAYVAFALAHPMLFKLMFGEQLASSADTALRQAGAASYAVIENATAAQAAVAGVADLAADASLAAWAL